jgi:nucleoside-diphosphate-sugar epimerase
MQTLVTDGVGFLGLHLRARLIELNHAAITLNNMYLGESLKL